MGGQGSARSSPVGLSGLAVSHLVLSSRTVWVRCPNGEVARRYGVSERNPAGDYWKKIPGSAHWLTGETGGDPGGSGLVRLSVCLTRPSVSPVCLSLCSSDARRRLVGGDSRRWTVPSLDQAPPTDPAKLRPLPHWRRRGRRMGTALSRDISAMSQRSSPEHFNPRNGRPAVRPARRNQFELAQNRFRLAPLLSQLTLLVLLWFPVWTPTGSLF